MNIACLIFNHKFKTTCWQTDYANTRQGIMTAMGDGVLPFKRHFSIENEDKNPKYIKQHYGTTRECERCYLQQNNSAGFKSVWV